MWPCVINWQITTNMCICSAKFLLSALQLTMDSSRLAYAPPPTEECSVLSTCLELSDCCSDDFRSSLESLVKGHSSPSAVQSDYEDSAAYMLFPWDLESSKDSNSCPRSPKGYGFPESPCSHSTFLLSCPPSWLESRPQCEDETTETHPVPLSSSPPEFTSSSPTSDISSELGKEEGSSLTSASSSTRSDTASISGSQLFDCGLRPDQFSQRLHELLLLVLRDRELERSSEETDCTTCISRSDDSGLSRTGSENDDQAIVTNIRASTPPSRTIISKWFSDQGFVHQSSTQPRYAYFCAYIHQSIVSGINHSHVVACYPGLLVVCQIIRNPATKVLTKMWMAMMMKFLPFILHFPVTKLRSASTKRINCLILLTHIC